jgi:hypothetical protein
MGSHTRALAVGSQALELGHDVVFCASGKMCQFLRERHYNTFPIPEPTFLGLPKCLSRFVEKRFGNGPPSFISGKSVGNIWLVLVLLGMTKSRFIKELVKIQLNAVKAFQPDVLFTELDPAAYLVSQITGIPLSTTFAKVALEGIDSFAYRRLSKVANDILQSYGKPQTVLSEMCFGSNVLKIIPSIPELDGTDPAKPDVCYVGNLLKDTQAIERTPISIEHGKKYIFAYFGTGSINLRKVKTILPQIHISKLRSCRSSSSPLCLDALSWWT